MTTNPTSSPGPRIDLDSPRWDMTTFAGRLRHFAWMTDYRTCLTPTSKLEEAKELVNKYKLGQEPPGTTEEQLWYAKKLYISAYHPDSGELQNFIGRMSFQTPGGMLITAGMLQFYKSTGAVILWQWINQSFNALVNYTNRNAASEITNEQIATSYATATSSAVITALGLKAYLGKHASSLLQRFVPFTAVAAANMVNIPLSRQSELRNGIAVFDENDKHITESRFAARKGISQVVFSRIVMAAPGMLVLPVIMDNLEKRPWFMKYTKLHLPFQTLMLGVSLTFMVPIACALFPQRSSITLERLKKSDPEKYEEAVKKFGEDNLPLVLYFNKGL